MSLIKIGDSIMNIKHNEDHIIRPVDFMIIGAQRAGTTSLYKFLNSLPSFCGSNEKEVGFFSVQSRYIKGIDWYHQQFQSCNQEQLIFEATPEYLYYPFVPNRIKQYNKNIKFIIIFRNPVERCYSAWKLFRSIHGFPPMRKYRIIKESRKQERDSLAELLFREEYPSFSKVVQDDIERFTKQSNVLEPSFVRRGFYSIQLSNWLQYFNLEKFLFLDINELNHSKSLLKKIKRFFSLSSNLVSYNYVMPKYNKINGSDLSEIDQKTKDLLCDFYRQYNNELFSIINKKYKWHV